MNSETSTRPGHVFVLLSMAAATVAVMLTRHTHPAALLVLSGAVLASGLAAYFVHNALASLFATKRAGDGIAAPDRRELLIKEKQRVLHRIKELEFDYRMKKVSEKDFQQLAAPLRLRAMTLMEDIDKVPGSGVPGSEVLVRVQGSADCVCGTKNDADAKFCKACGAKL
jgi:hypothetical protein